MRLRIHRNSHEIACADGSWHGKLLHTLLLVGCRLPSDTMALPTVADLASAHSWFVSSPPGTLVGTLTGTLAPDKTVVAKLDQICVRLDALAQQVDRIEAILATHTADKIISACAGRRVDSTPRSDDTTRQTTTVRQFSANRKSKYLTSGTVPGWKYLANSSGKSQK